MGEDFDTEKDHRVSARVGADDAIKRGLLLRCWFTCTTGIQRKEKKESEKGDVRNIAKACRLPKPVKIQPS